MGADNSAELDIDRLRKHGMPERWPLLHVSNGHFSQGRLQKITNATRNFQTCPFSDGSRHFNPERNNELKKLVPRGWRRTVRKVTAAAAVVL